MDDAGTAGLAEVTLSEHAGVRYLHLGTPWVQGAMRLRTPARIELEYVQRMMAWLLWFDPAAVRGLRAVQLGLGAGTLTRYGHRVLGLRCTAVEIHPGVIAACRQWFRLPADDARLCVVEADAGAWVREPARRGSADLLQVDLYDHTAAAPVLDDEDFHAACRDLLAADGVLTLNLFGRHASFEQTLQRLERVWGAAALWSLRPTREGNTVVVATRARPWPGRAERLARAAAIEARWGLPARKWLRLVRPRLPEPARKRAGSVRKVTPRAPLRAAACASGRRCGRRLAPARPRPPAACLSP